MIKQLTRSDSQLWAVGEHSYLAVVRQTSQVAEYPGGVQIQTTLLDFGSVYIAELPNWNGVDIQFFWPNIYWACWDYNMLGLLLLRPGSFAGPKGHGTRPTPWHMTHQLQLDLSISRWWLAQEKEKRRKKSRWLFLSSARTREMAIRICHSPASYKC